MNPMEKYFKELQELGERVLEETMCDSCFDYLPDEEMRYDPNIHDGKPICGACYAALTAGQEN